MVLAIKNVGLFVYDFSGEEKKYLKVIWESHFQALLSLLEVSLVELNLGHQQVCIWTCWVCQYKWYLDILRYIWFCFLNTKNILISRWYESNFSLPISSNTCWSIVDAPFTSPVTNFVRAESTRAVRRAGHARVMASSTSNARLTTGGTSVVVAVSLG